LTGHLAEPCLELITHPYTAVTAEALRTDRAIVITTVEERSTALLLFGQREKARGLLETVLSTAPHGSRAAVGEVSPSLYRSRAGAYRFESRSVSVLYGARAERPHPHPRDQWRREGRLDLHGERAGSVDVEIPPLA
jgi:hypothetical protein